MCMYIYIYIHIHMNAGYVQCVDTKFCVEWLSTEFLFMRYRHTCIGHTPWTSNVPDTAAPVLISLIFAFTFLKRPQEAVAQQLNLVKPRPKSDFSYVHICPLKWPLLSHLLHVYRIVRPPTLQTQLQISNGIVPSIVGCVTSDPGCFKTWKRSFVIMFMTSSAIDISVV